MLSAAALSSLAPERERAQGLGPRGSGLGVNWELERLLEEALNLLQCNFSVFNEILKR